MVVESGTEDLCFVFQPPERARMHNAVAIPLEVGPVRVGKLRKAASAAFRDRKPKVRERAGHGRHRRIYRAAGISLSTEMAARLTALREARSGSSILRASATALNVG